MLLFGRVLFEENVVRDFYRCFIRFIKYARKGNLMDCDRKDRKHRVPVMELRGLIICTFFSLR